MPTPKLTVPKETLEIVKCSYQMNSKQQQTLIIIKLTTKLYPFVLALSIIKVTNYK